MVQFKKQVLADSPMGITEIKFHRDQTGSLVWKIKIHKIENIYFTETNIRRSQNIEPQTKYGVSMKQSRIFHNLQRNMEEESIESFFNHRPPLKMKFWTSKICTVVKTREDAIRVAICVLFAE